MGYKVIIRSETIMKIKITVGLILAAMVGIAFTFPGVASAGDVVVIANKNAPAGSLTRDEVKKEHLSGQKDPVGKRREDQLCDTEGQPDTR